MQIGDFPRLARPSLLSQFARRCHRYRKHTGTDCRSLRRTDGRDGGGRGAEPGAVRVTMSVRRIKMWIMTAVCTGLVGLVATDVQAFGGGLRKKAGDCCNPCETANPCGPAGPAAPAAPAAPATQKVLVKE